MAPSATLLAGLSALAAACAPVTPPHAAAAAPRSAVVSPAAATPAVSAPASPSTPSPASTPSTPSTPSRFPPPDVAPPSARSAAPGDGHFAPFGDTALGERAATEPPIVVRTVLHPHPSSRWVTVTVAAMDLDRVALRLVPGTEDLRWANLPVGPESGLVPASDRAALVLVTNGGFQPKHGRWGLVANGVVVSKPREEGCTIAIDPSFGVRIGTFTALTEAALRAGTLRQTPPCLVEGAAVHPSLLAGRDKAWAGHTTDLKTRRRSALGLDASGTVLFYAMGEEAEPRWLAEALRVAGAASAAELDINWYWTRFLLFGEPLGEGGDGRERGGLRVTSTLVPKMEHLETEYVEHPSTRDFFYVARRDLAVGAR